MLNLEEKIKKLMELGREAADLSDKPTSREPSFNFTWQEDNTIYGYFYSPCLELGSEFNNFQILESVLGYHPFGAIDEEELEKILDHYIFLAQREIVALGRRSNDPATCN